MPGPIPTPSGVLQCWFHTEPGPDADVHSGFKIAYTGSGAPSQANLNSAATLFREAFSTHLAAFLCSDYGMVDTRVRDLANPENPYGLDSTEVVGTRSGSPPPNNVTVLMYFSLDRVYRGSKPKVWWPFGVDADMSTVTQWDTTLTGGLTSGFNAFITELTGETFGAFTLGGQVGVSYYGPPTIPNTGKGRNKTMSTLRDPPLVTPVTEVTVSPTFGSQRRRLRAG